MRIPTFHVSSHTVRRIFWFLLGVELLLAGLDYVLNYSLWVPNQYFRRLFNMARDNGLAGWFATTQTFCVAIVAAVIAASHKQDGKWLRRGWWMVAAFFLYMSADDGAKIHERLGSVMLDVAEPLAKQFPSYTWQIALGPFFILAGIFLVRFLWTEFDSRNLRTALLVAMGCFATAMGMDFVEGLENGHRQISLQIGVDLAHVRHYSRVVEEFLEMFANSLFLVTFLDCLRARVSKIEMTFS